MDVTRWRRFGKDRLYVHDEGADIGWWDLATHEGHPAGPDLESALVEAVTAWRVANEHTADDQDADGPTEAAEYPTATTTPTTREVDVSPSSSHPIAPVSPNLPPTVALVDGVAGGSAAHEFQRRHDARRERVQTAHPKIGRFLLAVFDDPQSTRAWSVGADGENVLGDALAPIAGPTLRVLHDRRIPKTSANIDHLVVCSSGVFVIDAKRYKDRRPELRVEGGILRPRTELLYVGGRDRTGLVEGMQKQLHLVRTALADHPDVPVRGVLCFVQADWPLIGGDFTVRDVAVLWPKKLVKVLVQPGPLDPDRIPALQWQLHEAFPRAKGQQPPPQH